MFHEIKGGTYEDIETLKLSSAPVRCWLPPIPTDDKLILFSDKATEDQFWVRQAIPDWYPEILEYEIQKRQSNPKYVDARAQEYRNQEWERRLNGVWFMNNDKPTYLTGPCYYYMNWWHGDHPVNNGYPIYYDEIRKRFYFREYCVEDPHCLGYVIAGPRGFGKTQEETSCITESITRSPRKRKAVLQSKSEEDAKKVFTDKIRPPFNDLPHFFKPVSNHGSIPEKGFSFYRDLVRGKKAKDVTYFEEEELQNLLTYAPAKEKQLSGQNIAELFNDEIGVTDPKKEADVYVRMEVNRFCVYRNNLKIGVIRATTTVEEMDKGGAEFKKVWDKSDITQRTPNGFTESGLYRYMVNDIDASIQFADRYGVINREKAQEFHDNERIARQRDHIALNSYIRKNPRDESEIFTKAAAKCHFDAQLIENRLKQIRLMESKPYRQGMFEWENNVRHSKVLWIPCSHDEGTFIQDSNTYEYFCPHCRYFININTFPSEAEANNVVLDDWGVARMYRPLNQLKWTAGADPYENWKLVDESQGSNCGFHIKRKYDILIDDPNSHPHTHVTNAPALEYIYRAGDVYEQYEDVLKALWFFGCEVLPEANKRGLQNWLETHYPGFLIKRPKGITKEDPTDMRLQNALTSSPPVIKAYTDAIEYDIRHNAHKYPFPRSLYQHLHFDNSNTQKFDASVSWGYCLLGAEKRIEEKQDYQTDVKFYRDYDGDSGLEIS